MNPLLNEIRGNAVLWLLAFVPVVFLARLLHHEAHTLLFVLSVLTILPLAKLLSAATEAVASRTGDSVGGLLNATLGNLTELVIALAALHAGQYALVKASIAGARMVCRSAAADGLCDFCNDDLPASTAGLGIGIERCEA